MDDMQMVTVYGAISPCNCPASYAGVTRLPDKGEVLVTVLVPYGVRRFPTVPCTIKVPTENTVVEFRKNERPSITVNYWESYFD
jgi:hypothetical protein